jgi:hypothetical protein
VDEGGQAYEDEDDSNDYPSDSGTGSESGSASGSWSGYYYYGSEGSGDFSTSGSGSENGTSSSSREVDCQDGIGKECQNPYFHLILIITVPSSLLLTLLFTYWMFLRRKRGHERREKRILEDGIAYHSPVGNDDEEGL